MYQAKSTPILMHCANYYKTLASKKLEPPTTCLNCLGILINTETFTMSKPKVKL